MCSSVSASSPRKAAGAFERHRPERGDRARVQGGAPADNVSVAIEAKLLTEAAKALRERGTRAGGRRRPLRQARGATPCRSRAIVFGRWPGRGHRPVCTSPSYRFGLFPGSRLRQSSPTGLPGGGAGLACRAQVLAPRSVPARRRGGSVPDESRGVPPCPCIVCPVDNRLRATRASASGSADVEWFSWQRPEGSCIQRAARPGRSDGDDR